MNNKTVQEMIAIMQAFANGHKIQYKLNGTKNWVEAPKPCWNWYQFDFRVVPCAKKKGWGGY